MKSKDSRQVSGIRYMMRVSHVRCHESLTVYFGDYRAVLGFSDQWYRDTVPCLCFVLDPGQSCDRCKFASHLDVSWQRADQRHGCEHSDTPRLAEVFGLRASLQEGFLHQWRDVQFESSHRIQHLHYQGLPCFQAQQGSQAAPLGFRVWWK